ncbi:hypothetical protein C3L33_07299, partial [Rhododendron williamsianum]
MATCHVVAMPYPGRGAINPMMNLCKLLASRRNDDILVTFVVTEEWLGLIGSETKPDCIRFVTIPNVVPSELVRADDMVSFIKAVLTKIEEPFEGVLDRLEAPADVILEPSVIDALQATFPFPVYSLGPLIPYFNLQYHNSSRPTAPNGVDYLEWLDSQPQSSVLYVSLGSFLSVSSAQMDEIAAGLDTSGVKYLKELVERAREIRETCRRAIGKGGSSEKNFETFMKDISK